MCMSLARSRPHFLRLEINGNKLKQTVYVDL